MSGNPGFQASPNSFQVNAFQTGVMLVGANYSVGSPAFAQPTITYKYALSASVYSLSSPSFATPPFTHATAMSQLHANPYSLSSPVFAAPLPRIYRNLTANAYSLGSPIFAAPAPSENYHFFTNAMGLSGLSFTTPLLERNFQLWSISYSLGSLDFTQTATIVINTAFAVQTGGYSLGPLSFAFPHLRVQIIVSPIPPSYYTQAEEAANILKELLNHILMSIPPGITPATNNVRRLASTLRDHAEEAIRGTTLGTQLLQVYNAADLAGATYDGIEMARQYLMSQVAKTSIFSQIVFRAGLVMTLALESKIITRIKFSNQEECQNMIWHVQAMFEAAKMIGIDEVDVLIYRTLNDLGGSVMNHLAMTGLKLPRYVSWESRWPMPSLYLSQRIYGDATHSDEIESENGVVHPAFVPTRLRVLSYGP